MSVSTGDILRFTMYQTLFGQQILNVDFRRYVDIGGSGNTYTELVSEYALRFTNDISSIQAAALVYTGCLVENLTNGLEFELLALSDNGGQANPSLPSHVAATVKLNRTTKITRNGSKRIAGITENIVNNNDFVPTAGAQTAVEEFFGLPIVVGDMTIVNDAELEPVIVGRTKDLSGIYQLDLTKINPVASATLSPYVSSQNTRKQGSGI